MPGALSAQGAGQLRIRKSVQGSGTFRPSSRCSTGRGGTSPVGWGKTRCQDAGTAWPLLTGQVCCGPARAPSRSRLSPGRGGGPRGRRWGSAEGARDSPADRAGRRRQRRQSGSAMVEPGKADGMGAWTRRRRMPALPFGTWRIRGAGPVQAGRPAGPGAMCTSSQGSIASKPGRPLPRARRIHPPDARAEKAGGRGMGMPGPAGARCSKARRGATSRDAGDGSRGIPRRPVARDRAVPRPTDNRPRRPPLPARSVAVAAVWSPCAQPGSATACGQGPPAVPRAVSPPFFRH